MWIWWGNSLCLLPPPLIHASRILQYLYLFLFHKSQALPFLHGRLSVPLCSVPCGCWSLSSRPPHQPMRKASTCLCLFSLSYITITPVLPIPSWRRKLATEFLKYLAVRVRATPPHGTVNHFPHHVICVLSHRYNYLRLPLLKYITTRRNSNSPCQTGNRLHNAPNSFSYLGGYSQLMTSRPYTYPYHFRIITYVV